MKFNLPVEIISVILPFGDLFSKKVWNHIQIILVGAILATGKRTITSILEVNGGHYLMIFPTGQQSEPTSINGIGTKFGIE